MHEHHTPSDEELNTVIAAVHDQTLEAVSDLIKGKDICAGCYSGAIIIGIADALTQVIVNLKIASAVNASIVFATDRIVRRAAFLQGHHTVDHNDYS